MKLRILLLYLFIINTFNVFAQTPKNIESIENLYYNYFKLNPEHVYTQINKSHFYKGEALWFKSYFYNTKTHKPYLSTTNVYASIYNAEGKLICKKIYSAQNGVTYGDFEISDSLITGTYYLKTSTNWMKNFNEHLAHITSFNVLGENENKTILETDYKTTNYDFQILPEGGHILNDAINTIGFKILKNNGKSIKIIEGRLFDLLGNIITTFKSNQFGIGKFKSKISSNTKYTIEVKLENGKILKEDLPTGNENGVLLSTENTRDDYLIVTITTNKNTLVDLINKDYTILIHRDGLLNSIKIKFENNKLNYNLFIKKTELLAGINIITLFNEKYHPVSERIIYNNILSPTKTIGLKNIQRLNDSTIIQLKADPTDNSLKRMSISVLPQQSIAYNNSENIKTRFLLNPYLKGVIENPQYYFKDFSRKTIYNLDLLLLTQGWSRYSWNDIFYKPLYTVYTFETGFTLNGKVNNKIKPNKYRLKVLSKENGITLSKDLNEDKTFTIDNLFLKQDSKINITLENKKNGNELMPNLYYSISPIKTIDSINTNDFLNKEENEEYILNEIDPIFYDNPFILDTINLSQKVNLNKPKNKPIFSGLGSRYVNFSNGNFNPSSLFVESLRRYGFEVNVNDFDVSIFNRKVTSFSGKKKPAIYLNNIELFDNSLLTTLYIDDVEEMFVSNQPSIYGAQSGGIISIFTKNSYKRKFKKTLSSKTIEFGFSTSKEYYSPLFNSYQTDAFQNYGAIKWFPDLKSNSIGIIEFKIPNYSLDLNLFIEGMSENGSLYSELIQIATE